MRIPLFIWPLRIVSVNESRSSYWNWLWGWPTSDSLTPIGQVHWPWMGMFSSLFCPPFGIRLLGFNSWFLNAGSGAICITTPKTFISYIDFWALTQPRPIRWPVGEAWEAGLKRGHKWFGCTSGFGNCKRWAPRRPPEEQGTLMGGPKATYASKIQALGFSELGKFAECGLF